MELFCIDLGRINKIEIGELIRRYQLPFLTDDLYLMKMDGYNKVYYHQETFELMFYSLNCSKRIFEPSAKVRRQLSEIVPLGFHKPTSTKSNHEVAKDVEDKNKRIAPKPRRQFNTKKEIENEVNRLLDLINERGYSYLSSDEKEFLKNNSNLL